MRTVVILMFVMVAVTIFVTASYYSYYDTKDIVTITVSDKERISTEESSKYLIFTESEVFENTDDLFKLKFNSSDFYAKLKIGETYTVEVYGWRVPMMSMYRNIIRIVK